MQRHKDTSSVKIYSNQPLFKWGVVIFSLMIGLGSIIYTNVLVDKIKIREKRQIDIYAHALESVANSAGGDQIFILEEIINANTTIPVILTDEDGNPEFYRNVKRADLFGNDEVKNDYLRSKITKMSRDREPIEVTLMDNENIIYGKKYIYYENSALLKQLRYYPYVQLLIIALFGLITYAIFNYTRKVEQNQVWVGLAKETAHQLGTPLSSLMAWVEYLKSTYSRDQNVDELNKDVERLQKITARFSSIGSAPHLTRENVVTITRESVEYLRKRLPSKVQFSVITFPNDDMYAMINPDLFSWVLENICKNAVDAMEGIGSIEIKIMKVNEGMVSLDIADTGKGIPKKRVNAVFKPGFTTKRRGWGLGLTLVKRIIENYHNGRIFIKRTELNKGTTFRVLLKST